MTCEDCGSLATLRLTVRAITPAEKPPKGAKPFKPGPDRKPVRTAGGWWYYTQTERLTCQPCRERWAAAGKLIGEEALDNHETIQDNH